MSYLQKNQDFCLKEVRSYFSHREYVSIFYSYIDQIYCLSSHKPSQTASFTVGNLPNEVIIFTKKQQKQMRVHYQSN